MSSNENERKVIKSSGGTWKPLVAVRVGGSRPYLWLGTGTSEEDERYLIALAPGQVKQLRRFLDDAFGEQHSG
jgi:hypothetical protein